MFDAWSDLDDTTLLVTVGLELRAERRATAAKVIAAGTFLHRRLAAATPASGLWAVDDVGAAAAELAAELGISRFRIQPLMELGVQLRDRFPTVTERFLAGDLDLRVVRAIHDRTLLLNEPDLVTQVDRHCADHAAAWNHLSDQRLTEVLDWLVVQLDPMATRRRRARRDHRYVHVLPSFEGACQLDGELPALDGARLDARLDAVAATVCHRDDRTRDQRRADALMALVDGHHHLTCTCGTPDCPAAGEADTRPATSVTVYVLAEHATLTGDADTPAYLPGHGPIPADTVRDLAQTGDATVRPLPAAAELDTEQSYRPSRRLAAYLFCRDLSCRFPACDRPAQHCDLDHTIPWPAGATHPSNTKAYCRFHHLLKTFWTGPTGWTDTQHPDGRVTFTSPTGRTYTTTPLGAWFFPQLATPTNTTPTNTTPTPAPPGRDHCTTRMPLRRRTRTAERTTRHTRERATNEAIADANPPPF